MPPKLKPKPNLPAAVPQLSGDSGGEDAEEPFTALCQHETHLLSLAFAPDEARRLQLLAVVGRCAGCAAQ